MLKKVKSINEINGKLFKNDLIKLNIDRTMSEIDGYIDVKLYDTSFSERMIIKDINVVIMLDKYSQIMNKLDGTDDKIEANLNNIKSAIYRFKFFILYK